MSSVVEIGSSNITQEKISNEPKDEVFSTSGNDQVSDLSHQFEQMQATEKPHESLTELFHNMTNQQAGKYDSSNENKIMNNSSTINQCVFQATSTRYSGETHAKTSVMASYVMYACQTASDTLIEGIRASVQQVLKNVPRIVITGDTDKSSVDCKQLDNYFTKEHESKVWFGNTDVYNSSKLSGGKLTGRHRSKTFYRPYCLLSRKYYNCQPLAVRRRKYGVSQKGKIEPGIDELTKLLDNLATNDDVSKQDQSMNSSNLTGKKKTLQYSPPPKYYMIRYRPSARLAGIKERSRSLNDLNLQGLQITKSTNNVQEQAVTGYQMPTLSNINNNGNCNTIQTIASSDVRHRGASGSQICQMVHGINKLNMIE